MAGEKASSRFRQINILRAISILLIGISINSCSIFKQKTKNEVALSSHYARVCLSGEGKGRVTYLSGRHLFSFESKLSNQKPNLMIGVDLPLHGQEILTIDAQADKTRLSGSFGQRLVQEIGAKNSEQRKHASVFFNQMGQFIKFLFLKQSCNTNRLGESKECTELELFLRETQIREFSSSDYYKVELGVPGGAMSEFLFNNLSEKNHYEQVHFRYLSSKKTTQDTELFSLKLFFAECHEAEKVSI